MAVFFKSWATIDALKRYRVAKYKQRRQLNHTFERGVKFFNENAALATGACTALCCDWIRAGMGGTAESRLSHLVGSTYFADAARLADRINDASRAGRQAQLEMIINQILRKRGG